MKKSIIYAFLLAATAIASGCKKDNYPGGRVAPILPLYDLRNLHKGEDVLLNEESMRGSTSITGVVISDHSGKNLPEGLLIIQDKSRLSLLRGIAIEIGAEAANYVPGDSVVMDVTGTTLTRQDGILQITGLQASAITKAGSNITIPPNRVGSNLILNRPNDYECTLVAIVKAGFDPVPPATETYLGDKIMNDGFGNLPLRTVPAATFANTTGLNFSANYYGIVFNTQDDKGTLTPHHRVRSLNDVVALSSTPEIAAMIISGYMADAEGGDGNYEYMQFLATKDIDFTETPFSVVVTSNAGSSSPTGVFPTKGWATGSDAVTGTTARTFKFNLTQGTVSKGEFFYVGGASKLINGANSTSIAKAKWIRSFNYTTADGDGFGLRTSGLFANSGNASGFAVFEGTNVDVNSAPIDVIFIGAGGSIYQADPGVGYKIANTDFYDKVDPISLTAQPYYRSGTNTLSFNYQTPSDQGFWNKLGGVYDANLGKWIKARSQFNLDLNKASVLEDIEGITVVNILDAVTGVLIRTENIEPTKLK
ncbi:MAG: DUF5689 domain-containing protein [Chitinophagaceae bacterium]